MGKGTIALVGVITCLWVPCSGAVSHESVPATDLATVTQELRETQEEILLLRMINRFKLSNAQLSRLLPVLADAQKRFQERDASDLRKLQASQPELKAVREQVLAGRLNPTQAEQNANLTLQAIQARRTELRAQLVATVRRALSSVVTREQLARMTSEGGDLGPIKRPKPSPAPPASKEGGSPPGWITRYMDQLRQMPPGEWEEWKTSFAERLAEGRKPERLLRDQYFMSLGEAVRAMSPEVYSQQKQVLASQADLDLNVMTEAAGSGGPLSDALSRFVDRYLLSPRMLAVIEEKIGSPSREAPAAR